MYKITNANIKEWAKNYTGEPFDGILCDPPYELGFMGKSWDSSGIAFDTEMWADLLRHIKPGGHLLAFSGSRTYHRMAVAIEDAGLEIRDMIEWVYGSGFPKSLNIGKAVDKTSGQSVDWFGKWLREWRKENNISQKEVAKLFPSKTGGLTGCVANWELGLNMPTNEQFNLICKTFNLPFDDLQEAQREFIKKDKNWGKAGTTVVSGYGEYEVTKGTSPYEGYGTALKPAHEPCVLARKPLEKGMTVATNALKHGTGGLNIDGSRVGTESTIRHNNTDGIWSSGEQKNVHGSEQGRFPANLIHDGSDEVVGLFPGEDDKSAARFFYTAKASKSERNAGLEGFEPKRESDRVRDDGVGGDNPRNRTNKAKSNHHPTVKPLSLTKYLANLIKPPSEAGTGGRLLVPFSGSGSEMIGALQAGWDYVEGVELTEEYIPIAEARIKHWTSQQEQEKLL